MTRLGAPSIDWIQSGDWPEWANSALQGLSYWIGHRSTMYSGYPLAEGALVGELCNLIFANLPGTHVLTCEVMYSKLLKRSPATNSVLKERSRADLVVSNLKTNETLYVVEVKRASAGDNEINGDLRRLASVKRALPKVHAYLFLTSEGVRPARFVHEGGGSIRGMQPIPGDRGHYRTRRTLKAAPTFSNKNVAQYTCLIEAFARPTMFRTQKRK